MNPNGQEQRTNALSLPDEAAKMHLWPSSLSAFALWGVPLQGTHLCGVGRVANPVGSIRAKRPMRAGENTLVQLANKLKPCLAHRGMGAKGQRWQGIGRHQGPPTVGKGRAWGMGHGARARTGGRQDFVDTDAHERRKAASARCWLTRL
jgi:hypothetical protein